MEIKLTVNGVTRSDEVGVSMSTSSKLGTSVADRNG